jgi:hypothetical protein
VRIHTNSPFCAVPALAGDEWGALVQYLLVAEQGDSVAASNAAFMLQQGQGYKGAGRLDLAAALYER